jgi:predicted RNase H-like HicB family nuclease
MTEYLVIYEQGEDGGWGAHTPDLPFIIAAAKTREGVEQLMREAIPFHLEGMREDGLEIPEPHTFAGYIAA